MSIEVSVIVPGYNHAAYLRERIDSVLSQSLQDFEVILLDDCSTDNSRDVLTAYEGHPKVSHIVLNEQNSGSTFRQWERGMALAKGKYIWIAESDDYADPDFLCRTVSALKNNEGAILAFTGSHMVDECGKTLRQDWDHFTAKVPDYSIYEGKAFVQRRMLWSNSVYNASMVVFERKAFEWVSDRYKQFRYCGDWMFWAEICLRGKVIHVNKKLNYFRQHSCKVSPAAEKEGLYFKEGCKVIEYLIDELRLSTFQKCVISGRMRKRLSGAKVEESGFREQILHTHQRLFMGGRLMIVAYQFDKLLTTLMFMQATLFRTLVKVS